MLIVLLILILAGSLAGATILWLGEASILGIVLGYVAGGWAGLILGLPLILLVRILAPSRPVSLRSPPARKQSCQHQ
ncbi:hypothetical protein [Paracoccus fontiphilus]|uniref:GlsB/YeaQ/YmgE family stress response membrane protein n=1 Tax=Paracoccus fontiphilus TaxID=1815556 RepID=A0ABV7IHA1_9RHOB|nr:hypothetical protein [Paracoccus fontiphilus]